MVNRITIWLSCFCAGAISAVFWQKLPSLDSMAVITAILIIVGVVNLLSQYYNADQQTTLGALLCTAVSGLLVGVLWVASVGHFYYAWQLPHGKIQQDVTISGRVISGGCAASPASRTLDTYHYIVAIETLNNHSTATLLKNIPLKDALTFVFDFKVRLTHAHYSKVSEVPKNHVSDTHSHDHNHGAYKQPKFGLAAYNNRTECLNNGDRFTAVVKLKPAYGLANPIGFNRQQHLVSQFVHATGYIKSVSSIQSSHHHSERRALAKTLSYLQLEHKAWWNALLLGDKRAFTNDDWTLLQRTGTGHLFSISGMHLSIVAGVCLLLLNPLVFTFAQAVGRPVTKLEMMLQSWPGFKFVAPVRILVFCVVMASCAFYVLLSGSALPVVRAFILLCIGCLLSTARLVWRPLNIGLAMLALSLLFFPLSMLGASFYLSIGAVFFIWFLVCVLGLHRGTWYTVLLKLQIALSVFMMPLTLIWFGSVSFIAIIANLIALPIITLLMPISLFSLLSLHYLNIEFVNRISVLVLQYCDLLFGYLLHLLDKLSRFNWSAVNLLIDSGAAICAVGAIVLVMLPSWRFKALCSLLLFIPAVSGVVGWQPQHGESWTLHVMDAGQASAIMVTKGERAIIIDSGAQYNGVAQTASQHMLPLLEKLKVQSIDHVIHTHSDNDHAGGAMTLKQHVKTANAAFYSPTNGCERGKVFIWQGLTIQFMWPLKGNTLDTNATSCVVKIHDTMGSVLIPGDIEKSSEYALIVHEQKIGSFALNSDILIAPHHGSKTSSTDIFIKKVNPRAVIFTQGFENRWKFPAKSVAKRYENNEVTQYLTSYHGYTRVTFNKINFKIETQRVNLKKRWYLQARAPRHLLR
ncbi:DNA internalization-related competence protein ComEC/Rec2 [Alteromonas gracilis]|uniref:DNA internalization-related competence protein ComEC/Rec2 n=1 Tax=Alteromonas gracilis TaxID=1479524 RepID=UPI003736353B